jgi:hypothetical protein
MTQVRDVRTSVAALAVLGVLAASGCAAPAGQDDPDRAVLTSETTDSPSPADAPDTGAADTEPDLEPDIDPDPAPGGSPAATPVGGQPWDVEVGTACADALTARGVAGLQQVAQIADQGGVTSFWAGDRISAVCDQPADLDDAATDDTAPTLRVSGADARDGFGARQLRLSSTALSADAVAAVRFVAGGKLPWPVQQIAYTFPDGHTQQAAFVRSDDGSGDTWWAVAYTAEDGVLVDPDTDPADLEPLVVSVTGAAAEAFRLPWDRAAATPGQRTE